MKHLILFLYVLSLMSGIGIITVAVFFYFKTGLKTVKYYIGQHVFVTLYVFVDTASYYIGLNNLQFFIPLQLLVIFGVVISAVGLVYFLWLFANGSIGKEVSTQHKKTYLLVSTGIFLLLLLVLTLQTANEVIPKSDAHHTIFWFATIFSTVGVGFSSYKLYSNISSLEENLKEAFIKCFIVIAVLLPVAIVLNTLEYYIDFGFPTAMSPLNYFLINIVVLFYARRYYLGQVTVKHKNETANRSITDLSEEYRLTERELQVMLHVIHGLNNKEIGDKLYISPNTVKNHIYNVYKKLGISNRLELMSFIKNWEETQS